MQITKSRIQYLPTTILIIVALFMWVFTPSDVMAYYEATYAESAHGDPTSGVNRSGTECPTGTPCPTGDCSHCHDTFDPAICGVNELMLFAPMNPTSQTDNFCFQCHDSDISAQAVTNNDYGSTFGGGTANSTNIKDAFNFGKPNQAWDDGSSHNLQMLRDWWDGRSGGDWVTTDTNACVICHDPHYSQKYHTPPDYKTAVRRANARSSGVNQPRNLWGDEAGNYELMGLNTNGEYTDLYQAPYYGSFGSGQYEPAGNDTSNGSNLPNFVSFCLSCHVVYVDQTDVNLPSGILCRLTWTTNGEEHGKNHDAGSSGEGTVKAPYTDGNSYCLSCTDCHEPHGSPNPFLLRTSVNGKDGISISIASFEPLFDDWRSLALYDFCTACHVVYTTDTDPRAEGQHRTFTSEQAPTKDCAMCHTHDEYF
jgi:nitrate reductase cytochrome c-type subunit